MEPNQPPANIDALRNGLTEYLSTLDGVTDLEEVGEGIYGCAYFGTPVSLTMTITP